MYNNNPWGAIPSSDSDPPANNPFLESSASNRFPSLDPSQQSFQSSPHTSQTQPPSPSQVQLPTYGAQQNQQPYFQYNGQLQPQSPTINSGAGYNVPRQQLQPTGLGYYGQQYGQQFTYDGQLQPQLQPQPQYTGYTQFQQPTVSPQQYQQSVISQFDPYSGSGGNSNNWNGQNQNLNQSGTGSSAVQSQRIGPAGQLHPRHYIQSHKVGLESWDATIWKQALTTFEDLKRAWERRRIELQKHLVSGQYLTAEDIANVNGMIQNSESNIDSVTASLIQMQEVHSGYKHSLDAASKRRVREALNAGLQGLPAWP